MKLIKLNVLVKMRTNITYMPKSTVFIYRIFGLDPPSQGIPFGFSRNRKPYSN